MIVGDLERDEPISKRRDHLAGTALDVVVVRLEAEGRFPVGGDSRNGDSKKRAV